MKMKYDFFCLCMLVYMAIDFESKSYLKSKPLNIIYVDC